MATLASTLGEAAGVTWKSPSPLASNPRMVRMYAKQGVGDLTVQVGHDVFKPANIAIFNGKDWSTGVPDNSKRTVRASLSQGDAAGIDFLDNYALASAKANKKEWFSAQPTISDEQIEKLFCSALKQGNRGPELAVTMDRLDEAPKYELSSYDDDNQEFSPYTLPISSDPQRPTNIQGLLTTSYYVWVSTKTNGKKIDQWGLKAAPVGLLHVRDASADNMQALTGTPAALPQDPAALTLGPLSDWAENGFAFADIGCANSDYPGQRFTLGDKSMDVKLWQAYGESGVGTAVSADVLLDDATAGAVKLVDDAVRALLHERATELGASGPDEVDECLTPALRGVDDDYPSYVRFGLGKTTVFRSDDGPSNALTGDEREAALRVEGKSPARVSGRPVGLRFYICAKRDIGGTLESLTVKIGAAGLCLEGNAGKTGATSMFNTGTGSLKRGADAEAAVGHDGERVKKLCTEN